MCGSMIKCEVNIKTLADDYYREIDTDLHTDCEYVCERLISWCDPHPE